MLLEEWVVLFYLRTRQHTCILLFSSFFNGFNGFMIQFCAAKDAIVFLDSCGIGCAHHTWSIAEIHKAVLIIVERCGIAFSAGFGWVRITFATSYKASTSLNDGSQGLTCVLWKYATFTVIVILRLILTLCCLDHLLKLHNYILLLFVIFLFVFISKECNLAFFHLFAIFINLVLIKHNKRAHFKVFLRH